ncbi:hypothetical protein FKG96_01795 [Olivibacter sp. LS-1]|nr:MULTISPECIES: hypothetical protein [unclassified Olivibacter]MDM8177894.1 hypothetical protein [Olivibacter sp. 47]QEK99580.1 hypothetical protein FKG96_01795 [Olivibacter sp. LS-1]
MKSSKTEGAPIKNQIASTGSHTAHPADELGDIGTMGFRKNDGASRKQYELAIQQQCNCNS